ncbi:MAG TPA: 30S ribosomal protein S15 [Candidatus Paceibacterota bacterium]
MALAAKAKQKVIDSYQRHAKDTGSADVQIALLTSQIKELTDHLKAHNKDQHSRRGLLGMVAKRKKLLTYLSKTDTKAYARTIKKLGLRK